ncbi:MAG: diphthamide biosynthesis enzyme Dph2 [Candidatus Bathyarchaeota archaeon]|nr:diphthamide biosynthesis enzyme Dph2 [Candidatus Bathyarchaeum tardum]WGM89645.1 MAG: diphthamide biosynthesis enzyme Dph2 [Candidatus Bathyarchaeum tardum]WNZ30253.1 MAG: diphthamide biosynthesis enzyme Dph2 [Candidatus Bathyarchaeota archaeon]
MSFDFEENQLKEELTKRAPKIVLLQLPEGLKPEAPRLAKIVQDFGVLPIVSSDPCYGACDLAVSEAELLGADLIIHYGHTSMIQNSKIPTVYFEAPIKIGISEVIAKALSLLKCWNKIGLITTVQHIHQLDEVKNQLEAAEKTVFVGNAGHLKYPGQVLGCDFSNALAVLENVEAYVYVGGGRFHAIGVALTTGKPTIIADPYEQIAYPIQDQTRRIVMQRWANISEAKTAKHFGILVSLKPGQMKFKNAQTIKEKLEKNGFSTTLFALKEISPPALMQFPTIDAFVNTACPRLALDDAPNFDKPILSINETRVLLGELKWEDLLKNGWLENAI